MTEKRFTVVAAPFGKLFITAQNAHIIRIGTERPHAVTALRQDSLPLLHESADALRRYLNGECTHPSLKTAAHGLPFQREIYTIVCDIPYGHTLRSQELAAMIGKPHAIKAVEAVCKSNPLRIAIPSHRVLLSQDDPAPDAPLCADEVLRRMEKRYLDKGPKRR